MKQFKHMQFLKDLSDIVGGFKITPMTDEEIDSLELRWHTKLPLAYREVFKIEGKTNAFGLRRNEYSIEEFDEMQEEVRDIIRRNDLHIDMDKIFAFSCFASLGNFCFYRLDEGENPPVYIYIGGQENYKKSYETFTDFIKSEDWYIAISLLYNSKDKE